MSQTSLRVQLEAAHFAELRRRILEAEPELDDQTLHDTLEGCTNLRELIGEIVRSALEDASIINAIKGRLDDLKTRLARFEHREATKRDVARAAMEQTGLTKLIEPDCTISLRAAPVSLSITDEGALPEGFWVPQAAKLDKVAVLNALKAGTSIPGAELSNPRQILSVRTR